METRWYFFIPIAPILVIILVIILLGGVSLTFFGYWLYDHVWYIWGFVCLIFLINFILIIRASDIICALSFLIASTCVLYYIYTRSTLFAYTNSSKFYLNLDYILCVIFYVVFVILLTVIILSVSWSFLDEDYSGTSILDNYHESIKYFFKILAVGAVGWGFNAFVYFVMMPLYSFTY